MLQDFKQKRQINNSKTNNFPMEIWVKKNYEHIF